MVERTEVVTRDCTEQAGDISLCHVYVSLLEQFMPSSDMTFEQWMEELSTEGASVHEEISAQFGSDF